MACVFENDSVGNHACFLDANEWFVAQKLEDFEKLYKGYITRTFHSADLTIPNLIGEWIAADTIKIMDPLSEGVTCIGGMCFSRLLDSRLIRDSLLECAIKCWEKYVSICFIMLSFAS